MAGVGIYCCTFNNPGSLDEEYNCSAASIIRAYYFFGYCFVAVENMMLRSVNWWRLLIIFAFGLLHGMGFASELNEIGLPPNKFYTSLISFNLGVEVGQLAIIFLVFLLIFPFFKSKTWYIKFVVFPLSALIALIALYWTVERVLYI